MSKLFEAEYGNKLGEEVSKYIESKTITENGNCEVYRPSAVVILFDQEGKEI